MSNEKLKPGKVVLNGIITENPTFRLVLGTCPTLAVTTMAINGIAMGLAVTFVLICSNMMISLLRKVIPDKIRIPAYITIIATFVTVVDMLMARYLPDLYKTLGLFIPLIVVNCIILGRAESFASKHSVGLSALDGLGMGLGFTLSLTTMGIIREFVGSGAIFGHPIPWLSNFSMIIFILPAGGFLTYGLVMALVNYVTAKIEDKKKTASVLAVAGNVQAEIPEKTEEAKPVVKDEMPKPEAKPEVKAEEVKTEEPKVEPKVEEVKAEEKSDDTPSNNDDKEDK